jgi:hypothetical protein
MGSARPTSPVSLPQSTIVASFWLWVHYRVGVTLDRQTSARNRRSKLLSTLWFLLMAATLAVAVSSCRRLDASRFDTISIRGSSRFEERVGGALALLKSNSPDSYVVTTSYVATIEQAKRSGMQAWLQAPRFQLNDRSAYYSLTWCAGVIAHDSFHSKLYHDYLADNPGVKWVPDKIWKGESAERQCLDHQKKVLEKIGAPKHETQSLNLTNRYWEVDYSKRNW